MAVNIVNTECLLYSKDSKVVGVAYVIFAQLLKICYLFRGAQYLQEYCL